MTLIVTLDALRQPKTSVASANLKVVPFPADNMTKRRLFISSVLLLSLSGLSPAQTPSQTATPHPIVLHAAGLLDIKNARWCCF